MSVWVVAEIGVGFLLLFTASAVIARPRYRSQRVLLGIAVASFAAGVLGVVDGVRALAIGT